MKERSSSMLPERYIYMYGGAIGETLIGLHLARFLAEEKPGTVLTFLSTRENSFVSELLETVTYAKYVPMPKGQIKSWLILLRMCVTPHNIVVHQPLTVSMPLWWRLVLAVATFHRGSIEVRCVPHVKEALVPKNIAKVVYDTRTGQIFDTVGGILSAWGIAHKQLLRPQLDVPIGDSPITGEYAVFHFFAGQYRRSIPTDHARELLIAAREKFPQHAFILTCAPDEAQRAEQMLAGISNSRLLIGTKAADLLRLLSAAKLVVGTASGVILMAAELPLPVVALCNLSDPCWLPSYNPNVALLAARDECRCNGDKTGICEAMTPEGPVYRCLYYIKTETIIGEMEKKLSTYA